MESHLSDHDVQTQEGLPFSLLDHHLHSRIHSCLESQLFYDDVQTQEGLPLVDGSDGTSETKRVHAYAQRWALQGDAYTHVIYPSPHARCWTLLPHAAWHCCYLLAIACQLCPDHMIITYMHVYMYSLVDFGARALRAGRAVRQCPLQI